MHGANVKVKEQLKIYKKTPQKYYWQYGWKFKDHSGNKVLDST